VRVAGVPKSDRKILTSPYKIRIVFLILSHRNGRNVARIEASRAMQPDQIAVEPAEIGEAPAATVVAGPLSVFFVVAVTVPFK
jgi:hypothetical protein